MPTSTARDVGEGPPNRRDGGGGGGENVWANAHSKILNTIQYEYPIHNSQTLPLLHREAFVRQRSLARPLIRIEWTETLHFSILFQSVPNKGFGKG